MGFLIGIQQDVLGGSQRSGFEVGVDLVTSNQGMHCINQLVPPSRHQSIKADSRQLTYLGKDMSLKFRFYQVLKEVIFKKNQIANVGRRELGGRSNLVQEAQTRCGLFTRWTTPDSVLILLVALWLRLCQLDETIFRLPLLETGTRLS